MLKLHVKIKKEILFFSPLTMISEPDYLSDQHSSLPNIPFAGDAVMGRVPKLLSYENDGDN